MVQQGSLVEVHQLGGGRPREQVPRELQHVVRVAGLGAGRAQVLREALDGKEALVVAVATRDVRAVLSHALPEEGSDVAVACLPAQLVLAGGADRLRDLGVGVQPVQLVLTPSQRIEHRPVVEITREPQVLGVAGDGEEVGQDLVHAAELGLERRLALLLAQPVHAELDPARHLDQHVEGLRVAAQLVHVEQAGHDLVERVVGRPHALALLQPVEELLGKRGQITRVGARRQSLLDLGQLRDHRVGAGLEARVAGRRVHQGARGQEVTDAVAAQLDVGCFPAAERRGRGGQPGVEPERVQEPVEVQAQQELLVPEHGLPERAVQQAHVGEGEASGGAT